MQTDTPSIDSGVWASGAMQAVLGIVDRVAPTHLPVLITGESGTGKEVIAQAVHARSAVSSGPLVVVDCAAIPPTLMESELFGHKHGAFTGAVRDRRGLVEAADGGTFFLDEIGELPPAVQVKLLRLLEDGSYRPVGESTPRTARIRTIAATNLDIEQAVADGGFRTDLYHRLNGCRIHLPPLRERRADIKPLLTHYLSRLGKERDGPPLHLGEEAAAALLDAHWPGNVRELRNVIRAVVALSRGSDLEARFLPEPLRSKVVGTGETEVSRPGEFEGWTLVEVERELIRRALNATGGHRGRAAERLGISPRTLYDKVRRLDLGGLPH